MAPSLGGGLDEAMAEAPILEDDLGAGDDETRPRRLRRQSAGARALREAFAEAPPADVPQQVGFPGGVITCPVCRAEFQNGAPGFMRHLTTAHAGCTVDQELLGVLRALHRAACSDPSCGGFRRVGMSQCNLCRRSTPARPIIEGDVVPGPRDVDPTQAARSQAAQAARNGTQNDATPGDVLLPAGFTERIRLLPGGMSQLHTPKPLRTRLARSWAEALEGMVADLPGWTRLAEARSRLLLTTPPAGLHVQSEIADRLVLWEAREWETLLARIEAQQLLSKPRRQRRQGAHGESAVAARKRRAKRMAKEGAYRKAVKTVVGAPASLTPRQEAFFAAQLLPQAERGDALCSRPEAQPDDPPRGEEEHPLKGVRFASLTAPGPSGERPEHAKELLSCHSRQVANRLCRAMGALQRKIKAGALIEEARWIKRSRLVFLEKKGSVKPRPIRVGEFLRSTVAKRLQRQAAPRLRKTFRAYHQWGVAMPGGAEALVHWRATVEELARNGLIEPLVAFDLDLSNMFGTIEWAEIREAAAADFPESSNWLEWQHSTVDEVELPSGSVAYTDRGAGQGDVYGSTHSSLALGRRMLQHRERFSQTRPNQPTGAADEWFIDDGQAFVKPELAESWLQSVDRAIQAFGGRREAGAECKSVARLLCPPGQETVHQGWAGPHIHATCKVLDAAVAPKVLGACIGNTREVTAEFRRVTSKVEAVRAAVSGLNHAPCELTLQRRCLDVSKASYLLRCSGDSVSSEALDAFDASARCGVQEALAGAVTDEAWLQATLGVDAGGLGLREASQIALPAFIASRVASRPLVEEMASHFEAAGLGSSRLCLRAFDLRLQQALDRWCSSLPEEGVRPEVLRHVADAADAATRRWHAWASGEAEPPEDPDGDQPRPARGSRRPGAGLVPEAGTEDPEHPAAPVGAGAYRLQRALTRISDACVAQGLLSRVRAAGDWEREHLLAELSSPDVSHEWLWSLHPDKGDALSPDDYIAATRLRLGCAGPADAVPCACCGNAVLGTSGLHALLCARGPSTQGHNAIRDELFAVASSLDSTSEKEPTGLIPSHPGLRPADLLTGASGFSGRLAALDVGVCCPAASGAGADCVESMRQRKAARIEPFTGELERGGILYKPIVFSCFGRPHADAKKLIQGFARRVARRRGTEAAVEERRLAGRIGLQVWRRAARMVRRCLPDTADDAAEQAPAAFEHAVLWRVGHPASVAQEPVA